MYVCVCMNAISNFSHSHTHTPRSWHSTHININQRLFAVNIFFSVRAFLLSFLVGVRLGVNYNIVRDDNDERTKSERVSIVIIIKNAKALTN